MAAPRIRRVSSQREMESLVDDYMTQEYEVLTQGEENILLRKKTWGTAPGHILWALLTAWWTIGIGNLIYALISRATAERVLVKLSPE